MPKQRKPVFEISDIFQFSGLVLLGVGLYLTFGLGIALSVEGVLLLVIGFFAGRRQ